MTRPTTPAGEITAMFASSPSDAPLSIVIVRNSGLAGAGDDLGRDRFEPRAFLELEQLAQVVGALRLSVLFLKPDLERLQRLAQPGVLGPHASQVEIAAPAVPHAIDDGASTRAGPRRRCRT